MIKEEGEAHEPVGVMSALKLKCETSNAHMKLGCSKQKRYLWEYTAWSMQPTTQTQQVFVQCVVLPFSNAYLCIDKGKVTYSLHSVHACTIAYILRSPLSMHGIYWSDDALFPQAPGYTLYIQACFGMSWYIHHICTWCFFWRFCTPVRLLP